MEEENPLLKALPPATDYLTYLTLVEYNLDKSNLPVLHQVLQDVKLTVNIGWDLVHLLLPLLPESADCLYTIARLGNPREVLLKVTESLRLIEYEFDGEDEAENDDVENEADDTTQQAHRKDVDTSKEDEKNGDKGALPRTIQQFETLLSMLAILHPRIKTMFPSRFIPPTLQAVLVSLHRSGSHCEKLVPPAITFVKKLAKLHRPPLPPREPSLDDSSLNQTSAPDPEAQPEAQSSEDEAIQKRLLQSLVSHLFATFLLNDSVNSSLNWSSRVLEQLQPRKLVPGKPTWEQRREQDQKLKVWDRLANECLSLADEMCIGTSDLIDTMLKPFSGEDYVSHDPDKNPSSSNEIALSREGALFLLVAKASDSRKGIPDAFGSENIISLHTILQRFIGTSSRGGPPSAGTESEAVIDAVLTLGLLFLENDDNPAQSKLYFRFASNTDEIGVEFTQTLQLTSLLSANTPTPSLRFVAHTLTTTLLHSHPSDVERLAFMRDTLEHCPYENLKASAVGWVKDETIEANISNRAGKAGNGAGQPLSVFETPVALHTLSPFLFPDLTQAFMLDPSNSTTKASSKKPVLDDEARLTFQANLSFYLATLNFFYLLLTSPKDWQQRLNIRELHVDSDIGGSFLSPLKRVIGLLDENSYGNGEDHRAMSDDVNLSATGMISDTMILDDALNRVERAVVYMNQS